MKAYAADYLNVEVLHLEHAPTCLAQGGEGVVQNVVQSFAVLEALL